VNGRLGAGQLGGEVGVELLAEGDLSQDGGVAAGGGGLKGLEALSGDGACLVAKGKEDVVQPFSIFPMPGLRD